MNIGKNVKNIIGEKFNNLTVIDYVGYDSKKECTNWLCKCDCGNIIEVPSDSLKMGYKKSCGCKPRTYKKLINKKYNEYNLSGDFGIGYDCNGIEFFFDLDDCEKIKDIRWNCCRNRVTGRDCNSGKMVHIYRIIMNAGIDQIVDHINRNSRDNRKENLRFCIHRENIINSKLRKNNTMGFIGVYFYKNKFRPQITFKGKTIHFKGFDNIEDALICRLQAELEYFGAEFAPQRHLFEQYGII